eukprot:7993693-Pyramimonas_sp.AAC.1
MQARASAFDRAPSKLGKWFHARPPARREPAARSDPQTPIGDPKTSECTGQRGWLQIADIG